MKLRNLIIFFLSLILFCQVRKADASALGYGYFRHLTFIKTPDNDTNNLLWKSEKANGFILEFTASDSSNLPVYKDLITAGVKSTESFFSTSFAKDFKIYIHPTRSSLDSSWQIDWSMPNFKSECWMVASGIATKLDMISPKLWDSLSCEHKYSDKVRTQQLITHELIHVFHGQKNASPDFSNVEGIDWFVEGLATYASGQCDSSRIAEIKKAISENNIPDALDNFWTGKLKYGLSGTVVKFLDHKFGRKKITELLPFSKKQDILSFLDITETQLLEEWKSYISDL